VPLQEREGHVRSHILTSEKQHGCADCQPLIGTNTLKLAINVSSQVHIYAGSRLTEDNNRSKQGSTRTNSPCAVNAWSQTH